MSRHYFFLCFVFLMASAGFSQFKSKAVKLYDAGNTAFAKNDYRAADSLFSLSLDLEPHPDAYYNRAVCRRKLGDSKGYCIDMGGAANMGDPEAYKIFWKQCAKRDTVYKNSSGDIASKISFDAKEYITSYKYNTNFEYEKYGKEDTLLLSKVREDNVVFYRPCNEVSVAMYKGSIDSLIRYIKEKTDFMEQVKIKHWLTVAVLEIKTNEKGKIIELKAEDGQKDESVEVLKSELLAMPEWDPARHVEKPVKFQNKLYMACFDTTLSIKLYNPNEEKFVRVETMPEFPGGSIEMMKFVRENLNYPLSAKEAGIAGKCFLKFVVNSDGRLSDIQILKGVPGCPECDKEAKRVILSMPKWKPGTQKGKPVPVFFNLPINFQLR